MNKWFHPLYNHDGGMPNVVHWICFVIIACCVFALSPNWGSYAVGSGLSVIYLVLWAGWVDHKRAYRRMLTRI